MRGNVPEHSINLNRICHTERSEVSQTVSLRLTPHLNPQPYGTQFHSIQLCFVGSASQGEGIVIANECEAIQLIYVVGVATPTYYLSFLTH